MALFGGSNNALKDMIKQQRRAANEMARRVAAGSAEIDFALRGYNDDYWKDRQRLYADDLLAQLERQRDDAYEQAAKNLAERGLTSSSIADNIYSKLAGAHLFGRQQAAAQAYSNVLAEKQMLQQRRAQLLAMLQQGMAPRVAAQEAASLAQSMQGLMPTAMADVFAGVLRGLMPAILAEMRGFRGTGLGWFRPPTSSMYQVRS